MSSNDVLRQYKAVTLAREAERDRGVDRSQAVTAAAVLFSLHESEILGFVTRAEFGCKLARVDLLRERMAE